MFMGLSLLREASEGRLYHDGLAFDSRVQPPIPPAFSKAHGAHIPK